MAMMTAATWQALPGKLPDFMANIAAAKAIHTRLGGKVRIGITQFGGTPSSVVYTIEHADWNAFGAFGAKMADDADWQKFWAGATGDPTAQLVSHAVSVDVPL